MEILIGPLAGVILYVVFYRKLVREAKELNRIKKYIENFENMTQPDGPSWWEGMKEMKGDLNEKIDAIGEKLQKFLVDDFTLFKKAVEKSITRTNKRIRWMTLLFIITLLIYTPESLETAIRLLTKFGLM